MTKKELKRIMLEVIAEADGSQYNKDDWYCNERMIREEGIKALAERLNIDLDKED